MKIRDASISGLHGHPVYIARGLPFRPRTHGIRQRDPALHVECCGCNVCRPSRLFLSSDPHVPGLWKMGSYLKEAVYLEVWNQSVRGERQQETKRSSDFLSQDTGKQSSEFGDEKTVGAACSEEPRQPMRASDTRNGAFCLVET